MSATYHCDFCSKKKRGVGLHSAELPSGWFIGYKTVGCPAHVVAATIVAEAHVANDAKELAPVAVAFVPAPAPVRLTAAEYRAKSAALQAADAAAAGAVMALVAVYDVGAEFEGLGDQMNSLRDLYWSLEGVIKDLEREWTTRNWTAQDFAFAELAAANID
jgi:hypothetical protein